MSESDGKKSSTDGKIKAKKKEGGTKIKKTRRHFRQEGQQPNNQEVPLIQEEKPGGHEELNQLESGAGLSPSAIVEMFHLQNEENSFNSVATARHIVENETSGDFYQVHTRQRRQQTHVSHHTKHRQLSVAKTHQKNRENAACWTILYQDGEKALVVMILGIATGMCWMDAINLHSRKTSGFDKFLCAYSAGSNRARQNLFILFKYPSPLMLLKDCHRSYSSLFFLTSQYVLWLNTGVLVGLIRKLSQLNPHSDYKGLSGGAATELVSYKLLQAATASILAALVVLLIGSPSALRLSRALQANVKWCEEVAPTSTIFQNGVVVLQVCAIFNTLLTTMAWLLVALRCSMTISSSTTHRSRIVELQEAVEEHKTRICELQGTHLENSSSEDLKALIQLHQRAIELTETVLVSRLQALHRPG